MTSSVDGRRGAAAAAAQHQADAAASKGAHAWVCAIACSCVLTAAHCCQAAHPIKYVHAPLALPCSLQVLLLGSASSALQPPPPPLLMLAASLASSQLLPAPPSGRRCSSVMVMMTCERLLLSLRCVLAVRRLRSVRCSSAVMSASLLTDCLVHK